MISFRLNGKTISTKADPEMPLLWFLRDELKLTGTKYGCGIAQCGSCTVHIDGSAERSCVTFLSDVEGREVTTIEGLDGKVAETVQEAWVDLNVVQCGYCQSGQIMTAAALLKEKSNPEDAEIDRAMSGNLCRCATYHRIRKAIRWAAKKLS